MSKKRICWVVASPLTIRFFLMGHIEMLAKKYDLTVITYVDDPEFLVALGVSVRVISVAMERKVSVWRDLIALTQLGFMFLRERYDLVHSLSPKSGLLAMVAAWVARVPVRIHTFQGEVWVTRTGFWRSFLKFLDKVVAKCATHLLVVSHSEAIFLAEQKVTQIDQLKILGHGSICGVDLERFKPDSIERSNKRSSLGIGEDDLVLLYVGRLNTDKGLLLLAQAFSQLTDIYPRLHLLLVGPDEENMRKKIMTCNAQKHQNMHFVDYTPAPEGYMAACDILCLPSYREGFGLVLIEAAATGVATVGSNIYGISDAMVDHETGLLFKVGSVDDLVDKLKKLIANPQLRKNLGQNGLLRARRDFSKESVLSATLNFYEDVLSKRTQI